MNDNDRIKLAEAMGWEHAPSPSVKDGRWIPPNTFPEARAIIHAKLPDPITDANDDYAVLEWMRKCGHSRERVDFIAICQNKTQREYKIGDYARAALKVIDHE